MTYQQHFKSISNNFSSFGKKLNNIFSKPNRDSEPESSLLDAPNDGAADDDDELLDSAPSQNRDWLNSGFNEPEESAIPPSNLHLMNRNSPPRINPSSLSTSRDVPLDDFGGDSSPSVSFDPTVLTPIPLTLPVSHNDPKLDFPENGGPSARLRSTSRGTTSINQTHTNIAEPDGESNHFSFSRTPSNSTESRVPADAIKPKWRYDDFETIDWLRDMARDRQRRRNLFKRLYGLGFRGTLLMLWDAASGWICVLLAGLLTGLVAVTIDIATAWMSDLREGVCTEAWWLSKEHCCWTSDSPSNDSGCSKVRHAYALFSYLFASLLCHNTVGPDQRQSSSSRFTSIAYLQPPGTRQCLLRMPFTCHLRIAAFANARPTALTCLFFCLVRSQSYELRCLIVYISVVHAQWHTYSSLLGVPGASSGLVAGEPPFAVVVNFVFYVATSICMASLAAVFVKVFAPYACGSGIGEVRTARVFTVHFVCVLCVQSTVSANASADQDGAVGLRDARLFGQVDAEHQEPRAGARVLGGPLHRQGGPDGAHRRLLRQHCGLHLPKIRQKRGQKERGAALHQ